VVAVYMQQNFGGAYFDCELVSTGVTAGDVLPGDVNGDGICNSADVTALYQFILNNDDSKIVNGDQNADNTINSADVTAVFKIILGV